MGSCSDTDINPISLAIHYIIAKVYLPSTLAKVSIISVFQKFRVQI